jgi:ABC-type Fe3+ transport system permease subunit
MLDLFLTWFTVSFAKKIFVLSTFLGGFVLFVMALYRFFTGDYLGAMLLLVFVLMCFRVNKEYSILK